MAVGEPTQVEVDPVRVGGDNREGSEHVTGVFRWLDRIYTNRLINYGKLLTYEFMVPEPARLYRALIATRAGSDESGSAALEAPIPLEELPLLAPADLTEGNYQGFAAAYGVSVPPPTIADTYTIDMCVIFAAKILDPKPVYCGHDLMALCRMRARRLRAAPATAVPAASAMVVLFMAYLSPRVGAFGG